MAVYTRVVPHCHDALSQYQERQVFSLRLGLPVSRLKTEIGVGNRSRQMVVTPCAANSGPERVGSEDMT